MAEMTWTEWQVERNRVRAAMVRQWASVRASVAAWGSAAVDAGRSASAVTAQVVDGEGLAAALERWRSAVATWLGPGEADVFAASAERYLECMAAVGMAERRAARRRDFEAGQALGRSEERSASAARDWQDLITVDDLRVLRAMRHRSKGGDAAVSA